MTIDMSEDKCRICLEDKSLSSIFDMRGSLMISTQIMSIAKIQIHPKDGLPSTICMKCLKSLDICTEFIQLCKHSDLKLRESLAKQLNVDAADNDEVSLDSFLLKRDINKLSPKSDEIQLMIDETVDEVDTVFKQHSTDINQDKIEQSFEIDKTRKKRRKAKKEQCFTCGKVMSSSFRLKTHLLTHTGEKPYTCSHCSRRFTVKQHLQVHMRSHTGEKPLQCSVCGASFAQWSGLATHRRLHTGELPHRCTLCPRAFRTMGHLQYHTRLHTGEKNFVCDSCGRAFIARCDLRQHLRTHSGDRPHVCAACGRRFTRASNLRRHMHTHTHAHAAHNTHACTQCAARFAQKTDYERHKKKHCKANKDS